MKRLLLLPFLISCSQLASTEVPNEIQLSLGGSGQNNEVFALQKIFILDMDGRLLDSSLSDTLGRFHFKSRSYETSKSYKISSADSSLQAWWFAGQESDQISLNPFSTWLAQSILPKGQAKKYKDSLSFSWFGPGFNSSILNSNGPLSSEELSLKSTFCAALWILSQDKTKNQILKLSLQNKSMLYDSQDFLKQLILQASKWNLSNAKLAQLIWNLSLKETPEAWEQRLSTIR